MLLNFALEIYTALPVAISHNSTLMTEPNFYVSDPSNEVAG